MFNIKDFIDAINHFKQTYKQSLIERKISDEILNGNILICKYCCGFVDKSSGICPHCDETLSMMGKQTLAIDIKDYSENDIFDYINEGIYIGRYSRGEEIILNN